jgi:hypothetical protein
MVMQQMATAHPVAWRPDEQVGALLQVGTHLAPPP